MRVERGELRGVAADDLVSFYVGGRAPGTFATYNVAFRKVWEHAGAIGCSVFRWGQGELAGLLVEKCKLFPSWLKHRDSPCWLQLLLYAGPHVGMVARLPFCMYESLPARLLKGVGACMPFWAPTCLYCCLPV